MPSPTDSKIYNSLIFIIAQNKSSKNLYLVIILNIQSTYCVNPIFNANLCIPQKRYSTPLFRELKQIFNQGNLK